MNTPSRLMANYVAQKASKVETLIIVCLCLAWVVYTPEVLIVGAVLIVLAGLWSYFENPRIDRHFSQLRKSRSSLSLCDFAREFDRHIVDPWVIRATYEQIQTYLGPDQSIPIKSSDNLVEGLLIDEEDLSLDLAEEIAQRTERSLKNFESNPYYEKVLLVSDMVQFFNTQPKTNAT